MNRCVFLSLLLVLSLCATRTVTAQLNPVTNDGPTVDLSLVTEGYVRNMKLLKFRMAGESPEVLSQMDVVIAQAEDLAKFFRAGGAASKRRKIVEERNALKFKADISKGDKRKMEELQEELRELDPEGFFNSARKTYNEAQRELSAQLELVQTSDPTRKDIIRLVRQHMTVYNTALGEY